MASAADSGVETGNDSNDGALQEKLFKMDLDSSKQPNAPDCEKETSLGKEPYEIPTKSCCSPKIISVDKSLSHLHPSSLMHGYEYQPKLPETGLRPNRTDVGGGEQHSGVGGLDCPGPGGLPQILHLGNMSSRMQLINSLPLSIPVIGMKEHRCRRNRFRNDHLRLKLLRVPTVANYYRVQDSMRMCRAACHNNTEAMKQMLESGKSPNVHDGYKRTPLHLAACMGYADMVKLLLDHGADPNAKDSIGNTPLHLAACTNHIPVITLLLKAGTRISAGNSPLQLAITKFNIIKRSVMPHPVLKEQVAQVISMLTEYMRRKEGASLDADLINKFESLVRVSDSSEQVEDNIRDLLTNLSSLDISSS